MKKLLIIVGIVLVLLVVAFFAFNAYIYNEKQGTGEVPAPYRGTLSGVQVCLPHKDTSGPQTLECAIGIKTDVGEYYALDFNAMPETQAAIANGQRFTASGTITPIEYLSSDHWQKYIVSGIFSVTDSVKLEATNTSSQPSAPSEPKPPVSSGKCYVGGCSSQLCTDQEGAVSTCEYREAYACYKTATCGRQSDGKCGWSETPELAACLASSN